jgi:hypothetical protein
MNTNDDLNIAPEVARAIAKEAYVYGFPLVDSYRIQYSYFLDEKDPEYKAPLNQIANSARVYTPNDKAVQTPNSDTPYSVVGADLRAEPLVLTFPAIEEGRYFSAQFIDAYTFNFDYVGSRTTGNKGGNFLLAGPGWKGPKPEDIRSIIQCETELATVVYRTHLFGPDDIDNVRRIQAGYKVQKLSRFQGTPAPADSPKIDFPKPISSGAERTSIEVFRILNFVLRFCPTHPSEENLMARLSKLGIGAQGTFDPQSLSLEVRKAVEDGIADAWRAYEVVEKQLANGERTSADLFGTRAYLKNNYLYRMVGAVDGIYGNSKEEALYPGYLVDSDGQRLDGTNHYTLQFAPGQLPPVHAFWSLTMYSAPSRLLVPNSLNRYLINSSMLPSLKRDTGGGLTLYIQHEQPGRDRISNWLPAPKGPFLMALRLYWPQPEALNGQWQKPQLEQIELSERLTGTDN